MKRISIGFSIRFYSSATIFLISLHIAHIFLLSYIILRHFIHVSVKCTDLLGRMIEIHDRFYGSYLAPLHVISQES